MNTAFKKLLIGAAALASTAALAPAAWAGCGMGAEKQAASWAAPNNQMLTLVNTGQPSIVGMWAFRVTGTGASSGFSEFGYTQWHSDGTEFTNAGSISPAAQNYCLGVWAQTGPFSYKLNHIAFAYGPTGALFARVNIRQYVTVNVTGTAFQGTFAADFYNPTTGALLASPPHISGNITGTRVIP